MKDSGVKWLGEIPEHWQILKLRWKVKNHKQGYYIAGDYLDDGVKLARISDISRRGQIDYSEMPYVRINEIDEKQFKLEKDDFVFARTGSVGHFGYVESSNNRVVFASYLIRFRFREFLPKYLKFFFQSTYFKESLKVQLHGGVNQNIHAENIKDIYQLFPTITDQKNIANFLEHETSKLDKAINLVENQIELIGEYRQTLITNAVTGKIDVRGEGNGAN
jgi:type I restriction enzyme S subunit